MYTLWIYGCSFSLPYNIDSIEYWGSHLAKKLNMKSVNRARAGVGWNFINNKIDEDILKWGKNDIIIISPSYFTRVTIEEFKISDCQYDKDLIHLYKDWEDIHKFNYIRWKTKIKTLQNFEYNIYTWSVEELTFPWCNILDINNLILADGHSNWKDWMDLHLEYWIDTVNIDWHFNDKCHLVIADIMYEFIKNNK